MKLNTPFVITISRQLGSGGAFIGQLLAQKLNIFYADRYIINQAAKQLSVLEEDLESLDERTSSFWQVFKKSLSYGTPETFAIPQSISPTDDDLYLAEKEIIEHIATERSSVIIGRNSAYILNEHPNIFNIFLHADISFRTERIQKLYNVSEKIALTRIDKSDKDRALYNRTHSGLDWLDLKRYDLVLKTSKIGLEQSVDLIMQCIES